MNNMFHHFVDLKIAAAGALVMAVNLTGFDVSLKILGSLIFIGYTIRRWYIMENKFKKDNQDEN